MNSRMTAHKFKQARTVAGSIQGECLLATAELANINEAGLAAIKEKLSEGYSHAIKQVEDVQTTLQGLSGDASSVNAEESNEGGP